MNVCRKISWLLLLVFSSILQAEGEPEGDPNNQLKLIELFTSHGCSSCPPADALLGELLASDDQLIALEFHVDYWDTLVHGSDGNFKDPHSKPEYSMRQRGYNEANLKGRPGVYTPQAVINGRYATVGSKRDYIAKALAVPVENALTIDIEAIPDKDALNVSLSASDQQRERLEGVSIMLAYYIDSVTTSITGGENNGKTVVNHHVVTQMSRLGEVALKGDMNYKFRSPGAAEGCVVLVQETTLTPVYAAAECP